MGRRKIKGNMDIELATDILEMAEHLDHMILFPGDGDFRRLVERVQRHGLRVSVVSTMKSSPPMVADELRRQADDFIELAELAALIARNPSERVARPAVATASVLTQMTMPTEHPTMGDDPSGHAVARRSQAVDRRPPKNFAHASAGIAHSALSVLQLRFPGRMPALTFRRC